MSRKQYPFWRDQKEAFLETRSRSKDQEIFELKEKVDELQGKLRNLKCPNCGHMFDASKV